MTIGEAYQQLASALQVIYEPREAAAIADLVVHHLTGFSKSSRLMHKEDVMTDEQLHQLHNMQTELLQHKPLQYVLHEAHFFGLTFFVNEDVLIPRPETEELVAGILEEKKSHFDRAILDIGTGSGCIAIALKKNQPGWQVSAVDVSEKALAVAKKNAETTSAQIDFSIINILDRKEWKAFPGFDCIVSNPPYITHREASLMHENVLGYEPHLALFVEDKNPLLFYEAICSFAVEHLQKEGTLYFEINESFGNEVVELAKQKGFTNVVLKKDMQGKDRMIKAVK